ncbi:hypothetical protein FBU30_009190 [Linnemannia zychae]|nr:hypothetical protein FBU30_009190 [Linnemannia zychae]
MAKTTFFIATAALALLALTQAAPVSVSSTGVDIHSKRALGDYTRPLLSGAQPLADGAANAATTVGEAAADATEGAGATADTAVVSAGNAVADTAAVAGETANNAATDDGIAAAQVAEGAADTIAGAPGAVQATIETADNSSGVVGTADRTVFGQPDMS